MRVLRVVVSPDRRDAARAALEERDFTLVELPLADREEVVFELAMPSNAVDDALDALEAADVELREHTIVGSAETAMTATSEALEREYAGKYRPMTSIELRTKARDLSRDTSSYIALMALSALIATAGLLLDSPAVVVGSMVIAPIIGPALTASVGTVTNDGEMVVDSLWMQLYGLGLAVGAAATMAAAVRFGGFVPSTLDLPSLELFGVRLAPNALSLVVGAAAGAAAGIGLTTKGPTSIIGVMIAAALIPTAAASGIAIAWVEPELAIGTAVLLVVTMIIINVAVLVVLVGLGYRQRGRADPADESDRSAAVVVLLVLAVIGLTVAVGVATVQQVVVDREIQGAVDDTLEDPAHEALTAVSVQTQYADMSPFTGPREVTVVVSEDSTGDGDPGEFADDLATTVAERTDESVDVRVETIEYETASSDEEASIDTIEPNAGARVTGWAG